MLGVSSNDTVSMVAMINFYKPALDELRNRLKDRRFALDELLRLLDMLFAEKYEPSMKDLLITTKKEIAVLAASANQAIFIEMVRAFYHRISVSENLDLFEEAINKRKDVSEILNKLNPENSDMDIFIKRARWRNKFDLEFPPS